MSSSLYRLREVTPPAAEPVSLADAKTALRVDHSADDSLIEGMIGAARAACEEYTNRAFVTREYALFLDRWPVEGETTDIGLAEEHGMVFRPAFLPLPKPPLASVDAILVHDEDGGQDTYPDDFYLVDNSGIKSRIMLKSSAVPPVSDKRLSGIEIRYTAGYGTAEQVPDILKQAIIKTVVHLYEYRSESDALTRSGAAQLLRHYRVMGIR